MLEYDTHVEGLEVCTLLMQSCVVRKKNLALKMCKVRRAQKTLH
jgi:hypothetical protein